MHHSGKKRKKEGKNKIRLFKNKYRIKVKKYYTICKVVSRKWLWGGTSALDVAVFRYR